MILINDYFCFSFIWLGILIWQLLIQIERVKMKSNILLQSPNRFGLFIIYLFILMVLFYKYFKFLIILASKSSPNSFEQNPTDILYFS